MHLDYELPGGETIRHRLERDRRAINTLLADRTTDDLVLEQLPSGDHAWLRPEPEDVRYVLTEKGHRALAMARAFDKGPTVAEVEKGGQQPI